MSSHPKYELHEEQEKPTKVRSISEGISRKEKSARGTMVSFSSDNVVLDVNGLPQVSLFKISETPDLE